jgi:hypothetical protein
MKYTKLIHKITAKTFTATEFIEILDKIEKLKEEYHQEIDEDEKLEFKKEINNYWEQIKGTTIAGNLNLGDNNKIKVLPDNLKVNGPLYLGDNNQIKFLPDNLKVIRGYLYLGNNNQIKTLPDNLKVCGDLHLGDNNQIKTLPNDLQVKGVIFNFNGDKSKVPEHLKDKIK